MNALANAQLVNVGNDRIPMLNREIQIKINPEYFLTKAHSEMQKLNYLKAYKCYAEYAKALEVDDQLQNISDTDYDTITELTVHLATGCVNRNEDELAFRYYLQTINLFPKNVIALTAFAVYLFNRGEFEIARQYLVKASQEGYLPAEKNLLHVCTHLIPRWHFRLLNDRYRNQCYKKAITKAIKTGCNNIVDIGTGSGLLSLIASSTKENVKVLAYEDNKALCKIAKNVFQENLNQKHIELLNENSRDCSHSHISVNLIITDIFDAGLFGENTFRTIYQAVTTLVKKPKYRIIPQGAQMYVTGFQSEKLLNKFRFTKACKKLKLENICLKVIDPEKYDAHNLNAEDDVNFLTETEDFLSLDFQDQFELTKLLNNTQNLPLIDLKVTKDGRLTSLAVWYDLHLDNDIKISTNPNDPNNKSWEQAIFHLPHAIDVKSGDVIKIKPTFSNYQVQFTVQSPVVECEKCFYVTRDIISFLNDTNLTDTIVNLVDHFIDYNINILDFNVFPLFGFLMCLKGSNVYHIYKDNGDLSFFEHVMEINNIPDVRCVFVRNTTINAYMPYVESLDYVFTDLIRSDGSWNRLSLTEESENNFGSVSLPQKVFLKALLIQSDFLDNCNKVDDRNVFNYKIAKFMNEFSGSEHPSLRSLQYQKYSDQITFDISDLSKNNFKSRTKVTQDGQINGIFYWFDMQYFDDEDVKFSTLNSSYYEKTCTYLKVPKKVKKGQTLTVRVQRSECYLKVYLD